MLIVCFKRKKERKKEMTNAYFENLFWIFIFNKNKKKIGRVIL